MMKNNSMTNFAFVSSKNAESGTFNIHNQAAVLETDPYQFLDSLEQEITTGPRRVESRIARSFPLSLN